MFSILFHEIFAKKLFYVTILFLLVKNKSIFEIQFLKLTNHSHLYRSVVTKQRAQNACCIGAHKRLVLLHVQLAE